jgi:hypothetical protein
VALPLLSRGADLGALLLTADPAHPGLGDEVEVAQALVAQAMTAYDNASLFARVQHLATADELTGIANRRRFFELAERDLATAARHGHPLATLMLDIDHFKRINDTFGHPTANHSHADGHAEGPVRVSTGSPQIAVRNRAGTATPSRAFSHRPIRPSTRPNRPAGTWSG